MLPEDDGFATPIYILNFNLLSYLQQLVAWLRRAGYRHVTVLDNHSTYPPLLHYYARMEAAGEITVVRREANEHKRTVWTRHLESLEHPFVLTTGDVVPDACCPPDVVARLARCLRESPQLFKAGLGLRIDDVPQHYMHRRAVLTKQSEYWRSPSAPGAFLADIDFTFALYRRGSPFQYGPALRTSWPCLARHLPWYADSARRSEEERYYEATIADGRGSWGRRRLPDWLRERCAQLADAPPLRLLHLGCGNDRFPGWTNVDAGADTGADLRFDLDQCGSTPMPISDASVDGMFLGHAFDRIANVGPMLGEMYRLAKPSARFVVRSRLPRDAADPAARAELIRCITRATAQSDSGSIRLGDWIVQRLRLVVDDFDARRDGALNLLTSDGEPAARLRECVVHLRPETAGVEGGAGPVVDVGTSPIDEHSVF